LDNCTSAECLYELIKKEIIQTIPEGSDNLYFNTSNNYTLQITSVNNELESLNDNTTSYLTVIDLAECADILKRENGLDPDTDLIILKYENITKVPNEKSVQYEVYAPNSTTKLNLSVCSSTSIDIYVPIELSEETQKLYEDLKSQGYNLFDKNDKFYTDICTPYESENNTDVLLSDRYNDFYIENQLTCQANCEYSDYSSETQYLKCECSVVDEEEIEVNEPEKVTAKSIFKSFYNVLKYSNYKVLKCYNLVFRGATFYLNGGSLLAFFYFLGYLASFFFFLYKKIEYLRNEISKLFNTTKKKRDIRNIKKDGTYFKTELLIFNKNNIMNTEHSNKKKNSNLKKENEIIIKNIDSKSVIEEKRKSKGFIGELPPKKKVEFLINNDDKKKSDNDKKLKMNSEENKKIGSKELLTNKLSELDSPQIVKAINSKQVEIKDDKLLSDKNMIEVEPKKEEVLTDFEYNSLEYLVALELDNRKFLKVYWSLLKREHTIIFTFFSWNDYNIFSIKLSKFFFLICTDMAFNVFFFSDDSMHNLYESGGEFNFVDSFVQMIYSTIISQVLQVFLNYLTMTDIHYYQIKGLKNDNANKSKVLSIINRIKFKIIAFYIFTFLVFLFYWYIVAAFCAVYENTQIIFITDSISSFLLGLVYPFVLYFLPTGLRFWSLKAKEKKNLKIVYWLSDVIPFF